MKFDHHLAAYLYKNKNLKLEGIGTFTLDEKVSVPNELEKEIYYPIEGLLFLCNPKIETDELLIKYLVEKLGKIQPLVRSDLESYLSNIKQFINLGKPYTIEGIGTLSKNNKGIFEFTPGNFLPVKEELNPKRENEEHNYPIRSQSSAGRSFVILLVVIALLAVLGGIGWGVSSIIGSYQKEQSLDNELPQSEDKTATDILESQPTQDSLSNNPFQAVRIPNDTGFFKMAFEVYRFKDKAFARATLLQKFGTPVKVDTIVVRDSIRYRLYLPVTIRQSDTTRVKDSLSILFGNRVFIAKNSPYKIPVKLLYPKPKQKPANIDSITPNL